MGKQVSALISDVEDKKILSLIEKGLFINKADFIRTAVRELLDTFKDPTEEAEG